jgi:hypothetical protein
MPVQQFQFIFHRYSCMQSEPLFYLVSDISAAMRLCPTVWYIYGFYDISYTIGFIHFCLSFHLRVESIVNFPEFPTVPTV